MNPCLLIPIYNHKDTIREVLESLAYLELPCLVIDDGSDRETRQVLDHIAGELRWVEVDHLPDNRGRGAALRHGYLKAARLGFSHVVQLDADGQHDAADVPKFLEYARRFPGAMILGDPIFDDSAPRSRLHGRRLSRCLVWAQTLSSAIRDPLCGFRCLPLEPTVKLIRHAGFGDRMEFDPVLVVRLLWEGVPVLNVPTRVAYFRGGLSHFHLVWDNVRLTRAYITLFCQMLPRLPSLVGRTWQRAR